jgi:hypothetical protein|nr:MAG TPA: hypothetical protein [Caudoviricetes sp.]
MYRYGGYHLPTKRILNSVLILKRLIEITIVTVLHRRQAMKAKIKRTGEIVDVLSYNIAEGDIHTYLNANNDVVRPSYMMNFYKDLEIIQESKEIDWEQRRYEIAKESLVAIMSNDEFYAQVLYESAQLNERRGIPYNISRAAVVFADTLIAELQQGGEE